MTFTDAELELAAQHADRWPVGESGFHWWVGHDGLLPAQEEWPKGSLL